MVSSNVAARGHKSRHNLRKVNVIGSKAGYGYFSHAPASKLLDRVRGSEDYAVNVFQPSFGVLILLLNSSFFGVHSPLSPREIDSPAVGARFRTIKHSRVKFRKDRDGTIVAFENCGCEAAVNAFRPCRLHQGDADQAVRLKAEARYHTIQKWVSRADISH